MLTPNEKEKLINEIKKLKEKEEKLAPKKKKEMKEGFLWRYTQSGLEFALSIILGVFFGNWADQKLNTSPLFLILGIILFFAAGLWRLIHLLQKS